VAVTAEAQSGVLGTAARIVLRGNACPVIESIVEPRITGEPSRDDAALAGALGDRSSAHCLTRIVTEQSSPMTGAAIPNRVGVADGGKNQHASGREVVSAVAKRYQSAE